MYSEHQPFFSILNTTPHFKYMCYISIYEKVSLSDFLFVFFIFLKTAELRGLVQM